MDGHDRARNARPHNLVGKAESSAGWMAASDPTDPLLSALIPLRYNCGCAVVGRGSVRAGLYLNRCRCRMTDPGDVHALNLADGWAGGVGEPGEEFKLLRHLSPRKTPAMSVHQGSGQALVRFVEDREKGVRGRVRDVYLGVRGTTGIRERYEEEIRVWVELSLRVGWCPEGWEPALTGHEGVLTVGELVQGYGRSLDLSLGEGWKRSEVDPVEVDEYRTTLERAREQQRRGRWERDHDLTRDGKLLASEARQRFGHLEADLENHRAALVLDDLAEAFGPMAAAAFGDRELRVLRRSWAERGRSLVDRKAGTGVIRDAFAVVVGREPWAPHDRDRRYLEAYPHLFGLDLGYVETDGRWVRTG
jgi:hypothetical protein